MPDTKLQLIAYISQAAHTHPIVDRDIVDIIETAKAKNPRFCVTGVLFYDQGLFLQVIEGTKVHLEQLMKNIKKDSRHHNVKTLVDETVERRGFSDWNMDFFDLSSDRNFEPEKLTKLADDFRVNLVPRGDTFVKFYKTILEQSQL